MDISTSLFVGEHIRLAPIDHEKDAEVESRWTHDPTFMRMLYIEPMRPVSPARIKKQYDEIEKEVEEQRSGFYFTIRAKEAGPLPPEPAQPAEGAAGAKPAPGPHYRLIGFVRLYWIEWNHGASFVRLGIGDSQDRGKGYGREALAMIVRYAFSELNLYRLTAEIPEYNLPALKLFRKAGFVEEVRRREALNRDGRRWDLIHMGLIREDVERGGEAVA